MAVVQNPCVIDRDVERSDWRGLIWAKSVDQVTNLPSRFAIPDRPHPIAPDIGLSVLTPGEIGFAVCGSRSGSGYCRIGVLLYCRDGERCSCLGVT